MSRPRLSRRAAALEPSATLAMSAKAKALQAEGHPVIAFTVGEPDFPTPDHILDAAKRAVDQPVHHRYTAVGGLPALRQAVAKSFADGIGVEYAPAETLVSPGGKYSIYLALQALVGDGDDVLLPAPYWVSYPEMARLAGANVRFVPTREEDGFALRADAIADAITPRTKLLILNSPANPSGGVTPPSEILKIATLLERHGVWCLSDEIYDRLLYGDTPHASIAAASPWMRDHTVVVNGVSKTYAMTGWRIGFAAGPKDVITAMDDLQSQSTSNPCAVAQAAALAALNGPQDCVAAMRAAFDERRRRIVALLNDIPGVHCTEPAGAFYVLPNIRGVLGRRYGDRDVRTPADFCLAALEQQFVAMVAGEPFGAPDHVRISYACSMDELTEGCRRLKALVASAG